MMSTSSHSKAENGVIQSSIGLLQERFRQLQRMKEMRENKELLRMFSDYNTNTNTNTNTTTNSPNVVSPSIVCNTSNTTSTITTISGSIPINNNNNNMNSNSNSNINNDNKNISDDSTMQDNKDNDQLQILFIPPNYSSLNNPKSSCYSSLLSSATTNTVTSTQSLSTSQKNSNMIINPSDVSLSLWSYNNNNNNTSPFGQEKSDNLLSAMKKQRRTVDVSRPSSTQYHHVSDVDTTLHL